MKKNYLISKHDCDCILKPIAFIKAYDKKEAIFQIAKRFRIDPEQLIAQEKFEADLLWNISLGSILSHPSICRFAGCDRDLHPTNKHGFCKIHREKSPARKNKKPKTSTNEP